MKAEDRHNQLIQRRIREVTQNHRKRDARLQHVASHHRERRDPEATKAKLYMIASRQRKRKHLNLPDTRGEVETLSFVFTRIRLMNFAKDQIHCTKKFHPLNLGPRKFP